MKMVVGRISKHFVCKGRTYFYWQSDFLGGCWHIYVSDDKDSHLFNLFSEDEFCELFEEVAR